MKKLIKFIFVTVFFMALGAIIGYTSG